MSMALMCSFFSISLRIASLQGSAPKKPHLSFSVAGSTFSSAITSARFRAYDGVHVRTVDPKSCISMIWRLVFPPEIGMTAAPIFSAP